MAEIDEGSLFRAVKFRSGYIKENIENLTAKLVRRDLENDMGLDPKSLDALKDKITAWIDDIINDRPLVGPGSGGADLEDADAEEEAEAGGAGGADASGDDGGDARAATDDVGPSGASDGENKGPESGGSGEKKKKKGKKERKEKKERREKVKEKKREARSETPEEDEPPKPKKRVKKAPAPAAAAPARPASAARGPRKGAAVVPPPPRDQARVDRLKQICRMASVNISPHVYVQAAGDLSVTATLLEELLSKHGLTARSSMDEIKAVKRTLMQDRDLHGIDKGNILTTDARGRRGADAGPAARRTNRYLKVGGGGAEGGSGGSGGEGSDLEDSDGEEGSGREGGGTGGKAAVKRGAVLESEDDEW